ncbi:RNA polymerase sigma factor [Kytococcus sp. Marseille-QA3725]
MTASAADPLDALERALEAEDAVAARRLLDGTSGDDSDRALSLLARTAQQARSPHLATSLFVEHLDASGMVRRMVSAALLDRGAVDDVTQESLISVAGSMGSFRGGSRVSTWVHSIVRRRVADHLRRRREVQELPEEEELPSHRMSSLITTRETVREALAHLPELYRDPVVLRDVQGLAYAEIADRLGRPQGTVKAQISRGRAMVAARLEDGGWSGTGGPA